MKPGKDFIGVGGGVLIFNENDEILLMKRGLKAKNECGCWSNPGGTVDFGEKVQTAMMREIKEELGIEIEIWGYTVHTDHTTKDQGHHWVAFNYLAKWVGGEVTNNEPEKCDAIEWFDPKQLPEKVTQTTFEPIENYLQGKYIRF